MTSLQIDMLKLVLALFLGAAIGAEREYKSKSIGFRTVILITLGSCLFTILSSIMGGEKDPTRIAANIVTGIGFLGAGAIFKEGANVKGITTAATIWIAAAIGMSIGIGKYEFAFLSCFLVLIVLLGFTWFQKFIDKTNSVKSYRIKITGNSIEKRQEIQDIFDNCGLKIEIVQQEKNLDKASFTFSVRGSQVKHEQLLNKLYSSPLIDSFEN